MKLYRTPTGHWAGTKDDAAFLAKTHDTTYEPCEVPYDKAGLIAFLNDFQVGAVPTAPVEDELRFKVQKTVDGGTVVVKAPPAAQKIWDRLALEEAILEAPLDTALALGELVMSRMRDFVKGK